MVKVKNYWISLAAIYAGMLQKEVINVTLISSPKFNSMVCISLFEALFIRLIVTLLIHCSISF